MGQPRPQRQTTKREQSGSQSTTHFDTSSLIALSAVLIAVRELAARASGAQLPPIREAAVAADLPPETPLRSCEADRPPRLGSPIIGWLLDAFRIKRPGVPAAVPSTRPLPQPQPLEDRLSERRTVLAERVQARLEAFCQLPGVPPEAGALLRWLADPKAMANLEARAGNPDATSPVNGLDARTAGHVMTAWRHVTRKELPAWFCDERLIAGESTPGMGLCTLLSQVNGSESERPPESIPDMRFELAPLSRRTLIPSLAQTPSADGTGYARLWDELLKQAASLTLPTGMARAWLDSFDSLLGILLHAVPADAFEAQPLDSLLELARLTAACGVSLENHARATAQDQTKTDPYRFVMGEFTPIQDFILGTDPHSPWPADALACGRSAFIKIASEVAAHTILERLGLPAVCKVYVAASKFMLLVPHTREVESQLQQIRQGFDDWSIGELAGAGGISLAWWMAPADAVATQRGSIGKVSRGMFALRYREMLQRLEHVKLRRFKLLQGGSPVLHGFLNAVRQGAGICSVDSACVGRPAPEQLVRAHLGHGESTVVVSRAAVFQLELPLLLGHIKTLDLTHLIEGADDQFTFFGVRADFGQDRASQGAQDGTGLRAPARYRWDIAFGLNEDREQRFQGLPVRFIGQHTGGPSGGRLAILKGDVDRLGHMFRSGIPQFSVSRLAQVSRELEHFFAVLVPPLLRDKAPNVRTVLAGGDDFIFVGPPAEILTLADDLRRLWQDYTRNPTLTFSVGIHVGRPQAALQDLDRLADEALARAKVERSSVDIHGCSVTWLVWDELRSLERRLSSLLAGMTGPIDGSGQAARLRIRLLTQLRRIALGWNDPRDFSGLRWRSLLHEAISSFCAQVGRQNRALLYQDTFAALQEVLDRDGFAVHRENMRIPLANLSDDEGAVQVLPPAARNPPASGDGLGGPEKALEAVLLQLNLAQPSEQLFSNTAMDLASAMQGMPRRSLSDLLTQLRAWDRQCDRQDDLFVLLRPQLKLHGHRPRDRDTGPSMVLRRGLFDAMTTADTLHCARWLFEASMIFYAIGNYSRRQLRPLP